MNILISIKPEYAREIFSNRKKYEYRRQFTKKLIERAIVHVCGVGTVGEFEIGEIIEDSPNKIWKKTWFEGEIAFNSFAEYFFDKKNGYAIEIKNPVLYPEIKKTINIPQNFRFI